jgi:hypothetical protein
VYRQDMQGTGASIAKNTTPVMNESTLYKIIGITMNMPHVTKNNIVVKEMVVVTVVEMKIEAIMGTTITVKAIGAMININYY